MTQYYLEGITILLVMYQFALSSMYIYKDESFFNTPAHIKLHAALWSAGRNEIYIIQSSTRTDIINARKPAMVQNGHLSLENLLLASTSTIEGINEERFSAYLFGNGTFWEQPLFTESIDEKIVHTYFY
ncbi:hypothetical protein [Flavobacterium phycosphaerae]|uniref:hypothetical protein n=1 Tax=Flavobacterium phycosphaerae TaxID=2697515 RepID=UPI00138AF740|nr:hypothetical protein [Flavobacterium phycosphaerae]